jgi:hypothetical protein
MNLREYISTNNIATSIRFPTFICRFYPSTKSHNTLTCHIPVRSYFSPFPSSGTDGCTGATAGVGQASSATRLSRRFRCEGRCRSDTRRGVGVGGIEQLRKRAPSLSAKSAMPGSTSASCAAPEAKKKLYCTFLQHLQKYDSFAGNFRTRAPFHLPDATRAIPIWQIRHIDIEARPRMPTPARPPVVSGGRDRCSRVRPTGAALATRTRPATH